MELTEQIAMVLLVFGLLGGLLWVLKKRGMAALPLAALGMGRRRGAGNRRMEVLERMPLTPQHAIHLVRVSGKVVLIGTAPSSCTILDASVPETFPAALRENILSTGLSAGH
jgi:flagellar biogenesis protein FliO